MHKSVERRDTKRTSKRKPDNVRKQKKQKPQRARIRAIPEKEKV
jgi:hypothetical protein